MSSFLSSIGNSDGIGAGAWTNRSRCTVPLSTVRYGTVTPTPSTAFYCAKHFGCQHPDVHASMFCSSYLVAQYKIADSTSIVGNMNHAYDHARDNPLLLGTPTVTYNRHHGSSQHARVAQRGDKEEAKPRVERRREAHVVARLVDFGRYLLIADSSDDLTKFVKV